MRRAREAEEVSMPRSRDAGAAAGRAAQARRTSYAARAATQSGSEAPVSASKREGAAVVRGQSSGGTKGAPKAETVMPPVRPEATKKGAVARVARAPCRWQPRRTVRPSASGDGPWFSRASRLTAPCLQRIRPWLRPSLSHC
jgi:hypothetical protein